jgi:hypothetical protein
VPRPLICDCEGLYGIFMRACLSFRLFPDGKPMQDLLYIFLIALFSVALIGLVSGCAALGERK